MVVAKDACCRRSRGGGDGGVVVMCSSGSRWVALLVARVATR
jgi:hypothetical protein